MLLTAAHIIFTLPVVHNVLDAGNWGDGRILRSTVWHINELLACRQTVFVTETGNTRNTRSLSDFYDKPRATSHSQGKNFTTP
jgi:hypothetical protein